MENQASVLFIESWENLKLQWDDVEFPHGNDAQDQHDNLLQQFLSQNEDAENDAALIDNNSPLFNSSYANRKKQKDQQLNWKDVDLDAFQNPKHRCSFHDQTILNKPNLSQHYDPELELSIGIGKRNSQIYLGNKTFNDIGNLHQSSMNEETKYDRDNEMDDINNNEVAIDIDNLGAPSNFDVSRSFLHQFTTPIVNNRIYLHNFQGSTHRTSSQQRRHPSDSANTNNRNISYNTPRHDNIR